MSSILKLQNKQTSDVSFPVQDLIGVRIQHFLYKSWADLYNFPVKK